MTEVPLSFFAGLDSFFDRLAEVLSDGLLASYLLAVDQVSRSTHSKNISEFADGDGPIRFGFDVKPDEAIDYFKSKKVVTRKKFDALAEDARSAAFTVSGVYKTDVLEGFKSEILNSLEKGTAQDKVIKKFRDIVEGRKGQRQLGAFHLETVFRTNMMMAYGVGRRRSFESAADDLPYWQYFTVGDDRVRPSHEALNGLILPADHEFWNTHYPPWSFNCRCTVIALPDVPDDYDHSNPSGEALIVYDDKGMPAKTEIGTSVIDLAAGDFRGVPRQGGLKEVIEAGVRRSE